MGAKLVAGVLVGVALLVAAPGEAQRRPDRRRPGQGRANETAPQDAAATASLDTTDRDQLRAAIEAIGASGNDRAIGALAARIRKGLPHELLDLAVQTLTVMANPDAGPILFELATHRRPEIRLEAIEGIIACRPRGADRALATALSDSHPPVRSTAASGLGQIGARGALDSLFLALDRNILEASQAIGQLAQPADVQRLVGYLGRTPFDAMTPAFNEILARRDVPERTKLDLIARLQELATHEVKVFLQEFVASLPEGEQSAVRRAAEDAILRIAD